MPYSNHTKIQDKLSKFLEERKPTTVLDVGCGAGENLKRYKKDGQHWTGIEIWEPYVSRFGLDKLYDKIIIGDVREILQTAGKFDVVIFGDVLEHMSANEAQIVFRLAKEMAKCIVVSIPIGSYPQGVWEDNPYEEHIKDDWTIEDIQDVFGIPDVDYAQDDQGCFIYLPSEKPKKLKVAVYAISRNEEKFARRCIEAAYDGGSGADCFILADTGSEDSTRQVALDAGATVHQITVNPWRFDTARNASLSLVPSDVDICVSVDLDEVLQPGWRLEVERLFTLHPHCTRLRYKYDWSRGVVFNSEKIHIRKGYLWKYPCHERLVTDPRTKELCAISDMLLIKHYPDETKDRGSYFQLMDVTYKENPTDKRTQLYFGRELQFNNKWKESLEVLKKYLDNPEYDWKQERAYCYELIADAHMRLGDHEQAQLSFLQGTSEAPQIRRPWLALASYARDKDWKTCLEASEKAINITDRELLYFDDDTSWGEKPYMLASLAAWYLQDYEKALTYGKLAQELAPNEQYLKDNLKFYREKVSG